jgi:predicted nuclease of predicted toxin-antitoxin system
VKLLVDANLSPAIAAKLRDAGYDPIHVIDVDLATAVDPDIVDYAETNGFAIIRSTPTSQC